jgi:hypothetical protein
MTFHLLNLFPFRCLTTILKGYFSKKTLKSTYKYSPSGIYYAPMYKHIGDFIKFIDKLPILDEPEIFGMHGNANITFQVISKQCHAYCIQHRVLNNFKCNPIFYSNKRVLL